MTNYTFYTTEGCHLCEQAWDLILATGFQLEFTPIDIIYNATDIERYGVRIPVIKNNISEKEIGWPFDAQQLTIFFGKH